MTSHPDSGPFLSLLHKALSHELPNQLVAIGGLARMIELDAGDRLGDAREYLERLSAAGLRCHQLVKQLAGIVRLVNMPRTKEAISLAEAVRAAVEELRSGFDDCVVQSSFAEDALTTTLPAPVLQVALVQTLTHALEASLMGPITLNSRAQGGAVVLEITHRGVLKPAELAKLFEPFAGTNLALASALLACHGGKIEVESRELEGTTIRVGV